jgi:hypothetical protein
MCFFKAEVGDAVNESVAVTNLVPNKRPSSGLTLPGGRPAVKPVNVTVHHENIQVFFKIQINYAKHQ